MLVCRFLDVQDALDLFTQGLGTMGSQPMSKEIGFFDTKFTFQGINRETFRFQLLADKVKHSHVVSPIVRENSDIVNVDLNVVGNITKNLLHDLLSNVGRLTNAHTKLEVYVKSEGSSNNAELLRFIIQFESVELHGNVHLCEELVVSSSSENVSNSGKRIVLADEH
jgi:hypothetical protein